VCAQVSVSFDTPFMQRAVTLFSQVRGVL